MTKRIIALLTALLMVFSAFLLAGCNKTTGDGDSDPTGKNLSAKELFKVSLANTVLGENAELFSTAPSAKGIKGTLTAEVNKLEAYGESVLPENKPIKASFNIEADAEKMSTKLGLTAEVFGEKPTAEVVLVDNVLYITDVLGLNDKAIKVDIASVLDSAIADSNEAKAELDELTAIYGYILDAFTGALSANLTDSAFAEETKDVTVSGKEFKGARVITLTLTPDMVKGIVKAFFDKIAANETISAYIGEEIDYEEFISEIEEGFGSAKIVNTVYNKESVALDLLLNDSDSPIFKATATFVDDNCSIKMAPTTEEGEFNEAEGILYFDRTVENGNEKIVIGFNENGEDIKLLTFEGTYANGKHDGTLKIDVDGVEVAIKLSLETGKGKFKLAISEISADGESIALDLVIDSTFTSTKENATITLKADIEGLANIDAKIAVDAEYTNVSISAPADSISYEELDQNTLLTWVGDISTKFPNIMQFVTDMMNSGSDVELPDDDFDYDYNYDEDYDYDYDYDYDFGSDFEAEDGDF